MIMRMILDIFGQILRTLAVEEPSEVGRYV